MGGAGRFFKISLKQRKLRPKMSSLVDYSDKKSCDLQSRGNASHEFIYQKTRVGFMILIFTILVSHFTTCSSRNCRYPLCLMRAHRRPSSKTANSPKELAIYNQVFQVLVLLAQEHQVQALWKRTTGRKENQKHMTNGPPEGNKCLFGCEPRGLTDLKAKMREKFGTKLSGNLTTCLA